MQRGQVLSKLLSRRNQRKPGWQYCYRLGEADQTGVRYVRDAMSFDATVRTGRGQGYI